MPPIVMVVGETVVERSLFLSKIIFRLSIFARLLSKATRDLSQTPTLPPTGTEPMLEL